MDKHTSSPQGGSTKGSPSQESSVPYAWIIAALVIALVAYLVWISGKGPDNRPFVPGMPSAQE